MSEPDLIAELLAHRDARCPKCRYNLRGVTLRENGRIVCPECGGAWTYADLQPRERFAPEGVAFVATALFAAAAPVAVGVGAVRLTAFGADQRIAVVALGVAVIVVTAVIVCSVAWIAAEGIYRWRERRTAARVLRFIGAAAWGVAAILFLFA